MLQAENALLRSSPGSEEQRSRNHASSGGNGSGNIGGEITTSEQASGDSAVSTAQLRVDLTEALRSQGKFQTRLKVVEDELETLRTKTRHDSRTIRSLTAERNGLAVKVGDRDAELRGKAKLVEDVQDELIALNLQLNIAEQQRDKVKKENKDLVDRWMQRMGQEAEAMNLANEPFIAKGSSQGG